MTGKFVGFEIVWSTILNNVELLTEFWIFEKINFLLHSKIIHVDRFICIHKSILHFIRTWMINIFFYLTEEKKANSNFFSMVILTLCYCNFVLNYALDFIDLKKYVLNL